MGAVVGTSSRSPAPYRHRVHTGVTIQAVARHAGGVTLRFADRPPRTFDHAVFACHATRVLPLLDAPTDAEREVLGRFSTSRNEVCLHTDASLLPRRPPARASWNYHLSGDPDRGATLTYHMNRLQSLQVPEHYCVSLNVDAEVDPSKTLRRMVCHHPLYTREAIQAQARWAEVSGVHRTHYCGAYWFYGFHEDGVRSALRVVRTLETES